MQTEILVDLAKTWGTHKNLKLSTVSTYAAGDGKFFARIENGAGCTIKTANRIVQWFYDNWPEDLAWPKGIARPKPTKKKVA